jgi:hypothetical protein
MPIVRVHAALFAATLMVGCGGSTFTTTDAGGSPRGDASGTDAHGGQKDAGHAKDTGAPGHDAGTSKDSGTKRDGGGLPDTGSPDSTSGSDGASPDAGVDAGTDSGTDAGVDSGSTVCPAMPPTAGIPCSMNGLDCEYGSDPSPACDTVVSCDGASWTLDHGPATSGCNTTNSATCPAEYADANGSCAPNGLSCDYPEARCTCGIAPPLAMTEWLWVKTGSVCPG